MIKVFKGAPADADILSREINDYPREYEETVREILGAVREKGDAAVLEYTERFDRVKLDALEVTKAEIEAGNSKYLHDVEFAAMKAMKEDVKKAIKVFSGM